MCAGTNTKSQGRDNTINHMNKSASWPLGSTNKLNLTCPLARFFCMPLTVSCLFIYFCLCYPCSLLLPFFPLSPFLLFPSLSLCSTPQHTHSIHCLALLWIHQSWGSCAFGHTPRKVGWSLSRFQLKLVLQKSCLCITIQPESAIFLWCWDACRGQWKKKNILKCTSVGL